MLENHRHLALTRRQLVDRLSLEQDLPGIGGLKTRNDAQQGGLPEPEGPKKATNSRDSRSSDTSSSTGVDPNALRTPFSSRLLTRRSPSAHANYRKAMRRQYLEKRHVPLSGVSAFSQTCRQLSTHCGHKLRLVGSAARWGVSMADQEADISAGKGPPRRRRETMLQPPRAWRLAGPGTTAP